jgi:sec-independent protein translocase protein TatB
MDSFFGIGFLELVFIIIFALIFLGPERLPQVLRDVINAIRKVRSMTSEITDQLNQEFGDLADLDPRRQIQKALSDDTKPQKIEKKPATTVAKTNSSSVKTTPAKTTTTTSSAPKKPVTQPKAIAAKSSAASTDNAESGAVAAAKAVEGVVPNGKLAPVDGNQQANLNGQIQEPTTPPAADKSSSSSEVSITHEPMMAETDHSLDSVVVAESGVDGAEMQSDLPVEQISPASAYFAQKLQSEKENGLHNVVTDADEVNSAVEVLEAPALPTTVEEVVQDEIHTSESGNYTIAPPEFHEQENREDRSVVESTPELPVENTAKESSA